MQLSYFHQLRVNADEPMQWDFATPLTSRTPLCVPVDSVRVTFTQHLIDADLVLRALNGCIVGLCSGADDEQVDLEHHDHSDDRDPRNDRGHSPLPCLGLGLVRAIDPVRRLLFVLTPLSADRLNQQHRLHEEQGAVHLVRGARQETSPCLLFQDQSLRDAAYAETTSPPTADVGGAVRKVRRNIQRRSRP